ncbi:nucleotidyltransferase domain-containing protein [Flexivirga oryzae]|uniref:Putative nucleotidyltransferase n=1 Tax=Flexivirga oryzae TaxID=1794944 RepID=A0A839N4V7_9MICO|nr:nucleotidyltransferase domain-containing protein [Flexivirga oryzae]MBB2892337.1 putative nucleotidyltransferase [Flexivirga oryzae]
MTFAPAVGDAIAPLPGGYADVLDRVVTALEADPRVVALWLSGSIGRGVADAGSDLDLIVTVADREADDVVAAGAATWAFLAPVVSLEMRGLPGSFALTTPEGLRVDVVLERELEVAETPYRHRVPVFDRRRTPTPVPAADEEHRGPQVATMEAVATEFARQLAIFPDAVVARGDWLLGQEAVHNYRTFLYQLYVESNQPLPPMGVKQWSAKLTAAQRDRLAALPSPAAEKTSVIDAMRQVTRVLRTEGRALVEGAGGAWPQAAVDAGLARWRAWGLD